MPKVKDLVKSNIVDICMVLDVSGSMMAIAQDVIGGYNSFIATQKENGDDATFSRVVFGNGARLEVDKIPIMDAKNIDSKEYEPRDCSTALYDGIGVAIKEMSKSGNKHVIMTILTDGQENNSKEYNLEMIKKLIEEKKSLGWEFIFLAADQDAFSAGGKFGITSKNCVSFASTKTGVASAYTTINQSNCSYRGLVRKSGGK